MNQFTKAAEIRERAVQPTQQELSLCLSFLETRYQLPECPQDWFTKERFEVLLMELDLTSTPGIPYMREAPTIGKWLKADGLGNFDRQQVERLWYDVQLAHSGNFDHYFRVFVKDEPHKKSKIEQQKWRLITCAALPIQMLWRMALKHQNDYLNNSPYETPSAHGLVFCYGGWRRFKAHCRSLGLRYSRDLSAWDTTAPGWVLMLCKQLRQRAGGPPDWLRVMDILYSDAFETAKLKFSNGVVLKQTYTGSMKSGLYTTISDNSLSMVALHCLASYRSGQHVGSVWCTGDDVLQEHISDAYVQELEGLGCVVKEYQAKLEFMGTDFSESPVPVYLDKHIVNFWTTDEYTEERLDSYLRLWCHSEWFDFWVKCARQKGITTKSRAYYQFWYNSPMARLLALM